MRGKVSSQPPMFFAIDLNDRIAADHPLRQIKARVEAGLKEMDRLFDQAYKQNGRPSVPPDVILKALLLQAIYSIRSERQLVERIDTDLLFRWFLGMDPAQPMFHATVFTHNRQRLESHGLISSFFNTIVQQAIDDGLCSDDHFAVDGTLIEAHASIKSVKPIEKHDDMNDPNDPTSGGLSGGRNEAVDFHGQRRTNQTHRSTTDPEARLYRKGNGKPAQLCHMGHAITENRNGLVMAVATTQATGTAEREAAIAMLDAMYATRGTVPATLAADAGYDAGSFYTDLVGRVIRPQIAVRKGAIKAEGEDADRRRSMRQRMRSKGYAISQRKRKLVEEVFAWLKTVGGLSKSRWVGQWKLGQIFTLRAAAYNLVRLRKLSPLALN